MELECDSKIQLNPSTILHHLSKLIMITWSKKKRKHSKNTQVFFPVFLCIFWGIIADLLYLNLSCLIGQFCMSIFFLVKKTNSSVTWGTRSWSLEWRWCSEYCINTKYLKVTSIIIWEISLAKLNNLFLSY
jgi:hypothetical protein